MTPTCERCGILLTEGIAINPTRPDIAKNSLGGPEGYITAKELRLDKVWKCSLCGNSKDMIIDMIR